MAKHARLSPSSADRWLTCTASVALEEKMPSTTSVYAEEGTFAHELAEYSAKYAVGMIGKREFNKELKKLKVNDFYSNDMQDYVDEYSFLIKGIYEDITKNCSDAFCEFEVALDLTKYVPEGFGTGDCLIIAEPALYVIDLKYGKGVEVSAQNNSQLKLYALGALERYKALYDIKEVVTYIVQPRLSNIDNASYTVEELEDWGNSVVKPNAKAAFDGTGTYKPSEKACRFCKASGECKARADELLALFDSQDKPSEMLTDEDFAEILPRLKEIKAWLADVETAATHRLYSGMSIPGYKLVEGKTNRKYTDETEIAKVLNENGYTDDAIFNKKLIGITAMEKLLGKTNAAKLIGDYIEKPKGSPTLALESDKREAINIEEVILNKFDEE